MREMLLLYCCAVISPLEYASFDWFSRSLKCFSVASSSAFMASSDAFNCSSAISFLRELMVVLILVVER